LNSIKARWDAEASGMMLEVESCLLRSALNWKHEHINIGHFTTNIQIARRTLDYRILVARQCLQFSSWQWQKGTVLFQTSVQATRNAPSWIERLGH
jgi:hypothetical protein